jgi:hypothetical protein
MSDSTLSRLISFDPAYDKRNDDPSKNYGIGGVTLRFILTGEKGVVQFVLYTHWQLPHVEVELDRESRHDHFNCHPMPADLGYHSPVPRYEGQSKMKCSYFSQGFCYYDGSGLMAEEVYNTLRKEGDEGVWKELERYYSDLFLSKEDKVTCHKCGKLIELKTAYIDGPYTTSKMTLYFCNEEEHDAWEE